MHHFLVSPRNRHFHCHLCYFLHAFLLALALVMKPMLFSRHAKSFGRRSSSRGGSRSWTFWMLSQFKLVQGTGPCASSPCVKLASVSETYKRNQGLMTKAKTQRKSCNSSVISSCHLQGHSVKMHQLLFPFNQSPSGHIMSEPGCRGPSEGLGLFPVLHCRF